MSPLAARLTMAPDGDGSVLIVVQADRTGRAAPPADLPSEAEAIGGAG
jgi:hypothetical protein